MVDRRSHVSVPRPPLAEPAPSALGAVYRMSRGVGAALVLSLVSCDTQRDGDTTAAPIDAALVAEVRETLLVHGIEPLERPPAPSAALVELGRMLFFDKELSGRRDVSCATCHLPQTFGGDGRALPRGVGGLGLGPERLGGAMVPRQSPSTMTAALLGTMFWDGRLEHSSAGGLVTPAGAALDPAHAALFPEGLEALAAQALFPPTSRAEMRGELLDSEYGAFEDTDFDAIWSALVARVTSFPAYVDLIFAAYPGVSVDDVHMAHLAAAIAAFEADAFTCIDTPFQAFVEGDDSALTNAQLRGALAFYSTEAGCAQCHSGSLFTDEGFHSLALPQFGPGKGDGPLGNDDFGFEKTSGDPADRYRFRTPSLINVALTAPYGHAGQYAGLRSIVEHHLDPLAALDRYDIAAQVPDVELHATVVANRQELEASVAPELDGRRVEHMDDLLAFLGALSASSASDLSGAVPAAVPSGASIDF